MRIEDRSMQSHDFGSVTSYLKVLLARSYHWWLGGRRKVTGVGVESCWEVFVLVSP